MAFLDSFYANPMQFANEAGLYALLSIIPLIIIYLLRPRAKKIKIPSVMFLLDIEKKKRLNIFRKFLKDPLFLIQLLALIIISLAIAAPFIMANEEAGGGSTVIILDASGSMQADGRFTKAVAEANKFLSAKNTIILAQSIPLMVMKEAPASSATDALSKLKAKATGVDLSSAILLGRRMLPEGGRIVVISDFISWDGDSPAIAKKIAEASGIKVDFITVSGRTDNIGIVNGWFESGGDYKVVIKNFNNDARDVNIDVTINDKNAVKDTINIKGMSSEYFSISDISLNPGITKISIDSNDALSVDNSAFVYMPPSMQRDVLYITDNPKSPSIVALGLIPNTKVTKADPKSIPSMSDNIVVVSDPLPQDAVKKLEDYVSSGGTAVIIASPGLTNMSLLPVEPGTLGNKTSLNIARQTTITDGIDIEKTNVNKYFKAHLKDNAVGLVESGDKEKSAILAYWKFGKGTVVYSGLADPRGNNIYDPLNEQVWNDLHALPDYPLFWKQMLEWIKGSLDVTEYNAKTGMLIKFPASVTVNTPADKVTTDTLLLDEVGIYDVPGKNVAVNLYDERESNLVSSGLAAEASNVSTSQQVVYSPETIRKQKNLDIYFIMAAMFLVFLELYYLRWRGEL
ncbi:MAG: VWA domain-containing protein [Candidatus Methanoperedens sp.]|nr:vWA domain-containing protein [Candidatus Methanoperedens sp. BLZ2]KAB2948076.1 MAG: VWA domain-containing protein [Candidatus Methanoperedens sp.]MBZ0173878.1 VWA domain-containing protein [Candidatus Methanoperedens nitroreducens]MCX9080146.1 VWA domain-containing protein [Candidatus Methanoperedens sp.]